jgi:multiple sugar transport system substrate-binding protein
MTSHTSKTLRRSSVGLVAALVLSLSACGNGGDPGAQSATSEGDLQAALDQGGTLTVWAWEPTLEQVVEDFEKDNPEVDIELVNAGTGNDQYTALQNAIAAGKGVPDVAQIEYYALPQFALSQSVTDLSAFGAADLDGTFTPGPWSSVQYGEGIYGLPMDSGPMALFYNKALFDKHGIDVPTTWDEYIEAARTLHEADPDVYITSDTGDAGFTTSLIWQAGGQPFQVDGENVAVDLQDQGTTTFSEKWQTLLDEELVSPVTGWSDEWFQGMNNGTIASLVLGAWMPANLESGVPDGKGKWAVAPMPQWEEGGTASAENGGSSLAVPEASEQKELAYAFLEYANAGQGVETRVAGGAFPATTEQLESEEFLNAEFPYFGGQKANQVFAESANQVVDGWSYLPYQVYANSVFNDFLGAAYNGDGTIQEGLEGWEEAIVEYGDEQGFTVE